MKMTKSRHEAVGRIDGFQFGDFNSAGKIDPWRIAAYDDALYSFFLHDALSGVRGQNMVFLRFSVMNFSPEFYSRANLSIECLLKATIGLVGHKSYWGLNQLTEVKTSKRLVERMSMAVVVDTITRKPTLVPDRLRDIADHDVPYSRPTIILSKEIPSDVFYNSVEVQHSDTDRNRHLSASSYAKLCLDCASVAATSGKLWPFTLPMSSYNIDTLTIEYVREVNAGDIVKIICWNDPEQTCTVHFVIKKGQDVACRCKVVWYADQHGDPVVLVRKVPDDIFPESRY